MSEQQNEKGKLLLLTVGLPRSGKSTWARQMNVPIINPDSIRLAMHGQRFVASAEPMVWAAAYLMANSLFLSGHEVVVVDATNITRKRRSEWVAQCGDLADVKYVIFDVSPDECKSRALAMGDEYILPVIDRMAAEMELSEINCDVPAWITERDNAIDSQFAADQEAGDGQAGLP